MCRHYSRSGGASRPPPITVDVACQPVCDCPRQQTRQPQRSRGGLDETKFDAARDRHPIPVPSHPPNMPHVRSGGRPGNYQVTRAGFDIVACLMTEPTDLPSPSPTASNMFIRHLVWDMLPSLLLLGLAFRPAAGAPP